MLQVNIIALTELTRLVLPQMVAHKRGKVMLLASTVDKEPAVVASEPNAAGYLAPQNDQLMSERRVLGFKPGSKDIPAA